MVVVTLFFVSTQITDNSLREALLAPFSHAKSTHHFNDRDVAELSQLIPLCISYHFDGEKPLDTRIE